MILIVELTVGEYRATCSCCKTFRSHHDNIEARAGYTNRVRDAVIDRLLDDSMNMEQLREAMNRDFLLDLSSGFLYDCLDWKVRQLDLPEYRRWTLDNFSGTLCIDEIHLGHRTLLLATDPLGDFPVAFALVSANDQDHMQRFLNNLKTNGFLPEVVVTDGSNLYPKVLAEVWPDARHQLCVFHVIKDINEHVLDAVRRLKRKHGNVGGRKRGRGRRTKEQERADARRGTTRKEQAYFIWKHRHLLVTRPENLDGKQRRRLTVMFGYLPELRSLRQFVLLVYQMFDPNGGIRKACNRREQLLNTEAFANDPDLAKALAMLTPEKFAKMIDYLDSPLGKRVRTNNHVERTNRRLRYLEKVRYKWRRRKTIVRFVLLAINRWRQRRIAAAAEAKQTASDSCAQRTSDDCQKCAA
jgi:transposase-like protein